MQVDTGRLWYLPQLPQVELLTGCYQQQVFPWHAHDGYCLSLQEQGAETIVFPDQQLHVRAGHLLVLAPGQVHTNYARQRGQPWQYRSFYLVPDFLQALAPAGYGQPVFPQRLLDDPVIFARLRQAHQQLEVEGYSAQAIGDLEQALMQLLHRHSQPGLSFSTTEPPGLWLPQLLTRIDQPEVGRLTVAELAAEAGMSRFQFTRGFALATGLTPLAYLLQQRLGRAKQLLRQGASPVVAALETGFFDQSHFARHFKRVVGATPGQYRALACTNVQDRAG